MRYNAQSESFEISPENLKLAAYALEHALHHIRKIAGLPLDKYERTGCLTSADHAQKGIIDAGKAVGIYLGADWGNELDLRET